MGQDKVFPTEASATDIPDEGLAVQFDFKNSPTYALNLASRLVTIDYLKRIDHIGIAPAQAYVLGELWQEEPLSQVELSRRLEIGKATIGQTLTRLERTGLIERLRATDDRRVIMIGLTPAGRGLRSILYGAALEQQDLLGTCLSQSEIVQFTIMLKKIIGSLRKKN